MPAVLLAILAKLVIILKLGLRNILKRITSFIFLNIYILPQHALTCFDLYNSPCFKITLNSTVKIKDALHINWRKPNLNVQQNHLALTLLSLQLLSPLFFSVFVFFCLFVCLFVFLHFSFIYYFRFL